MIESVKIVSFSEVRGEKTAVVTFSMAGCGFFCDGIKCEDQIQRGEACKNHEQGEAHDAVDELQGRLRELGNDILRVAEACPREHLDLSSHALEMLTNMNKAGGAK